jgi:hypothetical protein
MIKIVSNIYILIKNSKIVRNTFSTIISISNVKYQWFKLILAMKWILKLLCSHEYDKFFRGFGVVKEFLSLASSTWHRFSSHAHVAISNTCDLEYVMREHFLRLSG